MSGDSRAVFPIIVRLLRYELDRKESFDGPEDALDWETSRNPSFLLDCSSLGRDSFAGVKTPLSYSSIQALYIAFLGSEASRSPFDEYDPTLLLATSKLELLK